MDDLLTSKDSEGEALQLKKELIAMLKTGGFPLIKWRSNCEAISDAPVDPKLVIQADSTSVLGTQWNYKTDELQFKVQKRTQPVVLTKRIVTSEAARIFDPQGYVAPIVIRAKMFIQHLWQTEKGWDEALETECETEWKTFCTDVEAIEGIRIPRWLGTSPTTRSQIHIFCDASAKAYGAAVYVRSHIRGEWKSSLLCAKARVAPIKRVTIPRLELCAIELGSKLARRIRDIDTFKDAVVLLWTDSEIALHWIRRPVDQLKEFVANRVTKVVDVISPERTYHVRTSENPADLLSRGCHTEFLIENKLWWNGPSMLLQPYEEPPPWTPSMPDASVGEIVGSEMKPPTMRFKNALLTTVTDAHGELELIERWSSLGKVRRISAYVLRFCHLLISKLKNGHEPKSHWLEAYNKQKWRCESFHKIICNEKEISLRLVSIRENEIALKYWAARSQQEYFPAEIEAVRAGRTVERSSPLWTLTPRIDEDGLLRICGRLGNSSLPYGTKHPMILSRHATVTRLLAEEAHRILCHAGVNGCSQLLRAKSWILGKRVLLRTVVSKCNICIRYRQLSEQNFMADLPNLRVQPAPAFECTGVDYAGPIALKLTRNTSTKGWIAVFVCMRYRTVHLELVSGLDTGSFLAALQRFVNLRAGCVRQMFSDNGTNFIGAARELREAAEAWRNESVSQYLSAQDIEWKNTTPYAPHQGGIWERMVQQVKVHLRKMSGARLFTYEELATLLTKISAVINSRPITPLSSDPSDLTALTPSHFLSSRPIVSPLEEPMTDAPMRKLDAWQQIAKMQQEFHNQWMKECFSEQQKRNKWAGIYRNMKVGDLVLIKSDIAPPCKWPMGRIVEVYRGPDGRIRSCRVKTESSEVDRPITKLCLLPIESDVEILSDTE